MVSQADKTIAQLKSVERATKIAYVAITLVVLILAIDASIELGTLVDAYGWAYISIITVISDYSSIWVVAKVFLLWVLLVALIYYAGAKIYGTGTTEKQRG